MSNLDRISLFSIHNTGILHLTSSSVALPFLYVFASLRSRQMWTLSSRWYSKDYVELGGFEVEVEIGMGCVDRDLLGGKSLSVLIDSFAYLLTINTGPCTLGFLFLDLMASVGVRFLLQSVKRG